MLQEIEVMAPSEMIEELLSFGLKPEDIRIKIGCSSLMSIYRWRAGIEPIPPYFVKIQRVLKRERAKRYFQDSARE